MPFFEETSKTFRHERMAFSLISLNLAGMHPHELRQNVQIWIQHSEHFHGACADICALLNDIRISEISLQKNLTMWQQHAPRDMQSIRHSLCVHTAHIILFRDVYDVYA